MQSKEEINKKKGKFSEQLDLVDAVDTSEKIRKKRIIIFIFLFLTVGLSLSFLIFRQIKDQQFKVIFPKFNLKIPKVSILPKPDPTNPIINSDPNTWNICLYDLSDNSQIYSRSCHLSALPTSLPQNPVSILKSLPNGLDIKENLISSNQSLELLATIISPVRHLLLAVKIYGSSPLSDSRKLIPPIADALYWRFSNPD